VSSRIGRGPWARSLGTVLVPDDSTPEAIRGEELWRQGAVEDLRIETGQITARVEGCTVTITAPTIPPRIWDAMVRYAQNRGPPILRACRSLAVRQFFRRIPKSAPIRCISQPPE